MLLSDVVTRHSLFLVPRQKKGPPINVNWMLTEAGSSLITSKFLLLNSAKYADLNLPVYE